MESDMGVLRARIAELEGRVAAQRDELDARVADLQTVGARRHAN
jgi:uncharacterized coiled-coil protein SlyX